MVRLKTAVVVFEHDLCMACGDHKWMGMVFEDNTAPRIAIACDCDPELDAWIAGIAKLPNTDQIVCLDETAMDFVHRLSTEIGRDKVNIRRR